MISAQIHPWWMPPQIKVKSKFISPVVSDEARIGHPATAIWGRTTPAGFALLKETSTQWRPHSHIQCCFWRIASGPQPLFYSASAVRLEILCFQSSAGFQSARSFITSPAVLLICCSLVTFWTKWWYRWKHPPFSEKANTWIGGRNNFLRKHGSEIFTENKKIEKGTTFNIISVFPHALATPLPPFQYAS